MRTFYVYILARHTGVTSNLARRGWEHREALIKGFTRRYNVKRLVYIEEQASAETAIKREKAIKSWPRRWKVELIENDNPDWFDPYRQLNRQVTEWMPGSSPGMTSMWLRSSFLERAPNPA